MFQIDIRPHHLALAVGALLALARPAAAEEALALSCQGAVTHVAAYSPRLSWDLDALRGATRGVSYRQQRSYGRVEIKLENGAVAVRPFGDLRPARRSSDGWYALRDVTVAADRISGVDPDGVQLVMDRRSGDVRFGGFEGRCEAAKL